MTTKMSKEEFDGQIKRFGLSGISEISHIMLLKTGAVLSPQSVRTQMERYGHLSPSLTAAFRLLFRDLERSHEHA